MEQKRDRWDIDTIREAKRVIQRARGNAKESG